jgi:hypothetical protein
VHSVTCLGVLCAVHLRSGNQNDDICEAAARDGTWSHESVSELRMTVLARSGQ